MQYTPSLPSIAAADVAHLPLRRGLLPTAALCCALFWAAAAQAVPDGFVDELVATGLRGPTGMAFAPDGRLVITEQGGTARLLVGGSLQAGAFASMAVDATGERGLLGVAFHPNFASNQYVYFYRTMPAAGGSPARNRVTRFRVNGNAVVPSSATTIVELDALSIRTIHNGGAIRFGKDGKLYVAVGDNGGNDNARSLDSRLGKILRLNDDGTIPTDNPTTFPGIAGSTSGVYRAIWAVGLRNPFALAIHPHSGAMMINDVGEHTFEELNAGGRGRNYGWPRAEGPSTAAGLTSPLFAYRHGAGAAPRGCAVTGGAYYPAANATFPVSFVGRYFFADYCGNWIYSISPANPASATLFQSGLNAPVALAVGGDGALYYAQRGNGQVRRIRYTGNATQRLVVSATDLTIAEGATTSVSLRLAAQPAGDVVITVDPSLSDYLISGAPRSFRFTRTNWNTVQRLQITSQPDGDAVDEGARFLLWSLDGVPPVRVRVTVVDGDRPAGAPRAVIASPRTGDTVSGARAEFFGDGLDAGTVRRAEFYVDGVLRYTDVNNVGHYHIGGDHNMWNTTRLANGTHTLRMTVYDDRGLSGSHEVRVNVSN